MRAPLANARNPRFWAMACADAGLFAASLWLAYSLRFDFAVPPDFAAQALGLLAWTAPLKSAFFLFGGLYRGMWRYTGLADLGRLVRVTALAEAVIVLAILYATGFAGVPRSVFALDWVLTLCATAGLRLGIRVFYGRPSRTQGVPPRRVLVIGAGRAGELVAREALGNAGLRCRVLGFLDDDPAKRGRTLHGLPVFGPVAELAAVAARERAEEVCIAVSRATPREMRAILEACAASGLVHRILPPLGEIMDGRVLTTLRPVDYRDLLGRSEVRLDERGIRAALAGRTVLVTGCGGSIGAELLRQIVRFGPGKLVLVEVNEFNLFSAQQDLAQLGFRDVAPVLGSVADAALMERVFAAHRPQAVFHAAAYKHVPMLEENPWQAAANNVLGSRTVMAAARAHGAERFVLVSTDKAVRPASVMGASKRVTELLMRCFEGGPTRFMAVRFGNVVGSSGSVAPLFLRQIERGGPVTVTHPEARRYFMSTAEAAQLILQAGAMGQGGEIFVLDMGEQVNIADLARDLIRLSGKEPGRDVEIVFTGLRPGETLSQELFSADEGVVRTEHEKILVLGRRGGNEPGAGEVARGVERLLLAARDLDGEAVRAALRDLVPEYAPPPG